MAGFWDNIRESISKASAMQRQADSGRVWGFDEDKINYGNERDGEKLSWRSMTARNNDTGDDLKFDVGYDKNGRISGVREWKNDDMPMGYYGRDLVGSFFKKNFDRDATDYTIFDNTSRDDGDKYIIFDSKNDGSFIPSVSLDRNRRSFSVPDTSDAIDTEAKSMSEFLKNYRLRANTEDHAFLAMPDEDKNKAAANGTLDAMEMHHMPRTMQELDFFNQNASDFVGMAMEFSRTPDAKARMQLLQNAYKKYGSLPKFSRYLEIMAADEDAYKRGEYKDYDYRRVGHDIADAVNDVYKHYYHSV